MANYDARHSAPHRGAKYVGLEWHMRTAAVGVLLMAWSVCAVIAAQDAANVLRFEVASIKPSPTDDGKLRISIWGTTVPGGRWRSRNASLDKIIRSAYPDHPLAEQFSSGYEMCGIPTATCWRGKDAGKSQHTTCGVPS
jgi:hypothetical protein